MPNTSSKQSFKPVLSSKSGHKFILQNNFSKTRTDVNFYKDQSPYTEMYASNSNKNRLGQNMGDKSTPKNGLRNETSLSE